MPVSKKRKKAKPSRTPARRSGYRLTTLPESTEATPERVLMMPPEQLPSVGMAEHYLASSPIRGTNQCALASLVVMLAMRSLGLEAEPVALLLDVPDGRGGATRYGNKHPHMDGDLVVGHVGLIADGHFLDITAAQFPEIAAHGGVRVIHTDLQGQEGEILRQGAIMPTRLIDGYTAQYTVYPLGSADPVMLPTMEANPEEVSVLANNLVLIHRKVLSMPGLIEKVRVLTAARYAKFVAAVEAMQNREIVMSEDGRTLRAV